MNDLALRLISLINKQKEFQRLCGKPIDSKDDYTKNLLSETYIFKAGEELYELRKTFPSALNDSAKIQPEIDRKELLKEYSDVLLFLINFSLVWDIEFEELMETIESVQMNNFKKKLDSMQNKVNGYLKQIEE